MEVKAGYKQTDVGIIPEDWEVKSLGEVTGLQVGYAFKSSWFRIHDGIPLLRGENVGYGRLDWADTRRLAEKDAISFSSYLLQSGDIVIGMDRTFTKSGSKISLVRHIDCPCLLVQRVGKFVPKKCDPQFLWVLLTSERFQASLQVEQKGMDIPHLSRTEILSPQVPIPPTKAEQKAIADAFSDADDFIEALEQLIAKKRQVKQGSMQELLTGKRRLPKFGEDWITRELQEVVNQFIVPMRDKPKRFRGEIPWCRIEDFEGKYLYSSKSGQFVDDEIVREMSLRVHPTGTLLVSCSADLGRCAIVGKPLVSNQTFIGLVFDELKGSNEFFYYYMTFHAQELNNLSTGTTIGYLSREQFEAFKVKVPSTKKEQTAIAEILSDMDAEIAALEGKLSKARQVKQGMMQELLTGKVRLV